MAVQIGIQSHDQLLKILLLSLLNVVLRLHLPSSQHLPLLSTTRLLYLPLQLLLSLTLRVLLGQHRQSSETVVGLILDQVLLVIVAQTETSGSVTSEGSSESEEDKVLDVPLVFVGDEFLEILLGDVGFAFVVDVEEKFLSGEEFVDSESPGFDGDGH